MRRCMLIAKELKIEPWRVAQELQGWTRERWDEESLAYEWARCKQRHELDKIGMNYG